MFKFVNCLKCKFQDLVTLVHQQAETIKQLSLNDRRQSDMIQQLRKENAVCILYDNLFPPLNFTQKHIGIFSAYKRFL